MQRILFLIALWGLTVPSLATAQGRVVQGHIRSEAGTPLQGDATAVVDHDGRIGFVTERAETDGQYTLSINEGVLLSVVAKSNGYVSSEQRAAGLDTAVPVDFSLSPAVPVSGQVVNSGGQGVADAWVVVEYDDARAFLYEQEMGAIATDQTGNFSIPLVVRDRAFSILAYSNDRPPQTSGSFMAFEQGLTDLSIPLTREGQTVRVSVIDGTGQPVAGERVRLVARGGGDAFPARDNSLAYRSRTQQYILTSADGVAEFRGVPLGQVSAHVVKRAGPANRGVATVGVNAPVTLILRIP